MTSQPIGHDASTTGSGGYAEKLRTPWWWYLGAISVAVLLGGEFAFAVSGWITWVPLLILVPVCMATVWRLSAAAIEVADGQLRVPDNALELGRVDRAIALSPTELRRLVGRHSDPTAFVFIRSWVGPGVQLVLTESGRIAQGHTGSADERVLIGSRSSAADPLDVGPELASLQSAAEVPYWVVSTRRPERLLATLSAAGVRTSW